MKIAYKEVAMENLTTKKFPVKPEEYRLYEEVGKGVSATVHRALCIPLDEIVAIKIFDLEKCNSDLVYIHTLLSLMLYNMCYVCSCLSLVSLVVLHISHMLVLDYMVHYMSVFSDDNNH